MDTLNKYKIEDKIITLANCAAIDKRVSRHRLKLMA